MCEKLRNEEQPSKMATASIMLLAKGDVQIVYAGFRILEDIIRFHWHALNNQVMIKVRFCLKEYFKVHRFFINY